jgi:hypothetical protein
MKIYIVMRHWAIEGSGEGSIIEEIFEEQYHANLYCCSLQDLPHPESVEYFVEEFSVRSSVDGLI